MATVKAAKLFFQILGKASQLFAVGCQGCALATEQQVSSNRVCTRSTFIAAIAGFFRDADVQTAAISAVRYLLRANAQSTLRPSREPIDHFQGARRRRGQGEMIDEFIQAGSGSRVIFLHDHAGWQ